MTKQKARIENYSGLVWFAEQVVRKAEKEDQPTGYQSMRAKLTATVIVLHCVALIA
ncbi:MAG: hypothetical protein AAGJ78_09280 [Pseudomonadota bacterium]